MLNHSFLNRGLDQMLAQDLTRRTFVGRAGTGLGAAALAGLL
ncbi:MAG: hypothetical protein RIS92_1781, partial [Verrucomicrobiota bacterium]